MITIRTIGDIRRLREESLLQEEFIAELERDFKEITGSLTGREDAWETHDLEEDGPILMLQPGVDDPGDLGEYGLTRECGSLYEAPIEFTSLVRLSAMELFRTVLVLNNSFCLVIYSEAGKFGPELDDLLREHLID